MHYNNKPNVFRNYLTLFAKIFSDIYVSVPKEHGIFMKKVPISFGPAMAYHRTKNEHLKGKRTDISLPVMGFTFMAPQFDSSRVMNNSAKVLGLCNGKQSIQSMPIPFIIPMSLYIKTKNINELLEIIEQILPYFAPSLTFKFKMYDYGNVVFQDDIVLTLSSTIERLDNWEDMGKRDIEWQLDFDMKVFLFKTPQGNFRNEPLVDKEGIPLENTDTDTDTNNEQNSNVNIITEFELNSGVIPLIEGGECIDLSTIDIDTMFESYQTGFSG